MKTMNGFTNELLIKKAKRNWRTRCGAFLLAALASWYGGNAVFADATIFIGNRTLPGPAGTVFVDTPGGNAVAGTNAGTAGANAAKEFIWTGLTTPTPGLNLNTLVNGMAVNTSAGTESMTLSSNDQLTVTGSSNFMFNSDLNWGSGTFTITSGSSAVINAQGGTLNLSNKLTNNGSLTIQIANSTYASDAGVRVGNSTNTGTIHVSNANLTIGDNNFGGGGTIQIGQYGELRIAATQVSQNIQGSYNHDIGRRDGRGMIVSDERVAMNGILSGNIAFNGNGTFNLTQNNAISSLHVWNGANVRVSSQENLGTGNVTLVGGGGLTKNNTGNDLHLTNAITLEGGGSINSRSNSVSFWQFDADLVNDAGSRLYIDGALTDSVVVGLLSINNKVNDSNSVFTGGTVVLTNSNPGFLGDVYIERGVLQVSGQRNLGSSNDVSKRNIIIGSSLAPTERSVFRVVGAEGGEETITNWVTLGTQNSFYEVFTTTTTGYEYNEVDGEGNPIYRTQDGTGTRVYRFSYEVNENGKLVTYIYYTYEDDANGTRVPETSNVTRGRVQSVQSIGGNNIRNMADASRATVIQAGQIIGSGTLNKTGDGVLQLNTHNGYTGDTVVWHGVLRIDNQDAINNNANAILRIGGETNLEQNNFRPVFETTLPTGKAEAIHKINAKVVLNQSNSTVRTTGLGNRTVFSNTVYSDVGAVAGQYAAVLNKDGAGTLVLAGLGTWGNNGVGDTVIKQGTLEFSKKENLSGGTITIGTDWHVYKDVEEFDENGKAIVYKAILKLADNSLADEDDKDTDKNLSITIGNHIVLDSPAPGTGDEPTAGSYIEVGTGSYLTLKGNITTTNYPNSALNKIGKGTLSLASSNNSYAGWTNIYTGTLATVVADNMKSTAGVNLIGNGTTFDMSETGAHQTLNGLKGLDTANAANPCAWTRRVLIGDNTLTLSQTEDTNVLHGTLLGTGTLVKSGVQGSDFQTGFEIGEEKFKGKLDIRVGRITALTDAYITGLTGKSGTYFDIRDNTLTIDIGTSQAYEGTIISSYPSTPYLKTAVRPHIIKEGAGTLTVGFSETDLSGHFTSGKTTGVYMGDLTINQGNIISSSDYYMEGGGKVTFGVNLDLNGTVNPTVLDVSKHTAYFRIGGESGKEYTTVHVNLGDMSTGWTTPSGIITVGKILGNDKSDYTGLVASSTDSLFHELELYDVRGVGRYDKYVNLNVTGFGGIGDSFNTRAVGSNLDDIRVTDLSGNHISSLIQDLWAAGSNITDEKTKKERTDLMLGIYRQLSADTIANAMFMGLDKPWQAAFHRLNLDSQMVYVNPPQGGQYRGQAIANMRNLWFTPTVQSLSVRGDGNARKFGIDRPGYKVGFDKRVAQNTSLGFQLGYTSPKLHQGDDRIEASDFQVGIYGGAMVGYYVEMKGFIGFGHQNYKSNRNVYLPNDAVVPDGNGGFRPIGGANRSMVAHGRYDGDTFNFSFEVSRPLFLGFSILRPTIGLDSEHAYRYAFTESGDVIAMKFARSSLSRTRARFGLSLETTTLDRAIFTGKLGYSCLLGGRDYAEASGQYVNVYAPNQVTRSVAVGKSYFEAGVGMRVFLNPVKTLALVGNYDATIGDHWAEHQAIVGFTYIY